MVRWLKYLGMSLSAVVIVSIVSVLVVQRVADGPMEFLQGGPFKSGELVEAPVTDWSFGVGRPTEFELVGFGTSRTAGYIMHDDVAYMTCDLGFIWNRFESGTQRWILRLIYTFKRWHQDALEDGRALIRIDGKLYKTQFVKVEDPQLIGALKARLEELARGYVAPRELGPPPAQPPNDIWFFRTDPRT
jgi:hypothetical protein